MLRLIFAILLDNTVKDRLRQFFFPFLCLSPAVGGKIKSLQMKST